MPNPKQIYDLLKQWGGPSSANSGDEEAPNIDEFLQRLKSPDDFTSPSQAVTPQPVSPNNVSFNKPEDPIKKTIAKVATSAVNGYKGNPIPTHPEEDAATQEALKYLTTPITAPKPTSFSDILNSFNTTVGPEGPEKPDFMKGIGHLVGNLGKYLNTSSGMGLISALPSDPFERSALAEGAENKGAEELTQEKNFMGQEETRRKELATRLKDLEANKRMESENEKNRKNTYDVAQMHNQTLRDIANAKAEQTKNKPDKKKEDSLQGINEIKNMLDVLDTQLDAGATGRGGAYINHLTDNSLLRSNKQKDFNTSVKFIADVATKKLAGRASAAAIKNMIDALPSLTRDVDLSQRVSASKNARKLLGAIEKAIIGKTGTEESNAETPSSEEELPKIIRYDKIGNRLE